MIYKNAKTCLLTNGYRSCYFPISRSMRQGCPVSPLIFILQAEPLACAIRKNRNIIGFPLPRSKDDNRDPVQVKINAYVDDAQLFNSTENSIKESFELFERYERASGAKIHKTKTTGLYIGPWKTKTPEFTEITWTNNNVKTLGVHHGYQINLHEIWMEKITKIKNCIQVWKSRNLSLKGKVLIIKTFLISQIGYELEMNGIPKHIEKDINKLLWEFLWDGKQPLVNRQTMCFNLDSGGVNMINLRQFIEAKQIKFIHKISNSQTENWNRIGKHWLSLFDEIHNSENFLLHCSTIKGLQLRIPSSFYKEALLSWCLLRAKLQANVPFPILDEQICGNNQILHKSNPLWLEQFTKSGVILIKHIWDQDTSNFVDENVILQRLTDKRNAIKNYRLIKSCIQDGWINNLQTGINLEQLSNTKEHNKMQKCLYLNLGKDIKISVKQIQNILKIDTALKPKYMTKWESIFNVNINWKKLWLSSLETPLTNTEKQLHWKIVHNAVFTEYKLSLMGKSEGKCHFCKNETEYLTHLFYDCRVIKEVFKNLESKINRILQSEGYQQHVFNLQTAVLGVLEKDDCVRIFLNTILHIFKWEIWKIRNLIKYESIRYTSESITKIILNKIRSCCRFWAKTKVENKQKAVLNLLNLCSE